MKRVPFTTFARDTLKLVFTDAQRVLCKVAFDGVNPCDLEGEDRELARVIFGDVDVVPEAARRTAVLSLGRGSGKTLIAAALAIYLLVTSNLSTAGPGDMPVVATCAPDKDTAALSVRTALELVKSVPALAASIESEDATSFTLRRHDNRVVQLKAFAASRGGASVRGRSIVGFVFDESEFFRSDADGQYVVNDRAIFRALRPRLMPGGIGVLISTPWPVQTLMGELHEKNFGKPTTALAATAPTLLMRPDLPHLVDDIAAEREADPENAAREFDCDRDAMGSEEFFSQTLLESCVTDDEFPMGGDPFGALDLAFRRDASAAAIARAVGRMAYLDATKETRPTKGAPLKPSEVIADYATFAKAHDVNALMSDVHYIETVKEHLVTAKLGVIEAPGGATGKADVHVAVREMMKAGRVRMHRDPALLAQLRSIVAKPAPGGGLTIRTPRRAGNHGDKASAVLLALYQCRRGQRGAAPLLRSTRPREDCWGGSTDSSTPNRLSGFHRGGY